MTASRESVAYNRITEHPAPAQQEGHSKLHEAPQARRKKRGVRLSTALCFMLVLLAASYILFCQMQLTQLTAEVTQQTTVLEELTAQNVSLTTQKIHEVDLDRVEDYAVSELGMVKMDASQIEYIELVGADNVTVNKKGISLDTLFAGLANSFSAILEYIS